MDDYDVNTPISEVAIHSYLNDLTPEIKVLIIETLCDDFLSLRSLSLTCRTFQALVEPVLYRQANVRKGDDCHNLLASLESRPQRAEFIYTLDARYKYEHRFLPTCMSNLLRQVSNLRELILESPYSNYRNWTTEMYLTAAKTVIFQPILESVLNICDPNTGCPPLQNLKKLTLYWRSGGETRHWTLAGSGGAIFLHPSIVHLELSCANVDYDVLEGFVGVGSTPLKTLILAECNVSLAGLHSILSKPKALEVLYIGENRDHHSSSFPGFNNLFIRDHMKFFSALSQQRHSLISLTYKSSQISLQIPKLADNCEGFANFPVLEEITLEAGCPFLLSSITTKFLSPPNLARICIMGFPQASSMDAESDLYLMEDEDAVHAFNQAEQQHKALAELRSLQVVCFLVINCPNPQQTIRREVVEATSKTFTTAGKKFMVANYCQMGSSFPPYVHFEQQIESPILYDSETGGWEQWMKRWQPVQISNF